MLRYFRKRLLLMIPVMFGVALLIFTMLYLTPGDRRMIVGEMATEEEYQAQREEMGLMIHILSNLGTIWEESSMGILESPILLVSP